MTAKPILLSGSMVRAILDGRKTQMRRVLKPQPICYQDPPSFSWGKYSGLWPDDWFGYGNEIDGALPYQPGDRLWVREAFHATEGFAAPVEGGLAHLFGYQVPGEDRKFYVEGIGRVREFSLHLNGWGGRVSKNYPSVHMPRWASRLTLEVTDVRVQRLQEISEEDALAEGMPEPYLGDGDPPWEEQAVTISRRMQFRNLWDSLNAKRGYGWDSNPWIVAVTFTAHQQNIDSLEQAA